MIHIVDCHDCDFEAKHAATYTRTAFVKKLVDLSTRAAGTGPAAAQASFELANGRLHELLRQRAGNVHHTPHCNLSDNSPLTSKMDLAEKYSPSAPWTCRATRSFGPGPASWPPRPNKTAPSTHSATTPAPPPAPVNSPVYFKKLKTSFADTRYYQEIIKECGYFRRYLGR